MDEHKQDFQKNSEVLTSNLRLLTGGTLVALFSLLQSLDSVDFKWLLYVGQIFVLISGILSFIVNPFLASRISYKYLWEKDSTEVERLAIIQRFVFKSMIVTYILGLVFLVIFVNKNIIN
jgi:hypothetical protein